MASSRFVSRGGDKLQAAIENWSASRWMKIKNLVALDVGSSTGGFVDCLLQNGAKKVYALDTAYGELSWKLRNDSRVVVMERTNILHLQSLPEQVDLITIDAGWTKLELVLPVVKEFLKPGGVIIALIKPHYEANNATRYKKRRDVIASDYKRDLVKGVLPAEKAEEVKNEIVDRVQGLGYRIEKTMESPILGGAGNREYLVIRNFKFDGFEKSQF